MSPARLRVAVVQFAPSIGEVLKNITKAEQLCSRIAPHSVDLVCLPEMIFTGYVFPSAASISSHLEDPKTGPTSQFCQTMANRLHCYVVSGYPERLHSSNVPLQSQHDDDTNHKVGYNSAILYGPGGELVGDYRKTNLFETDMSWALPGDGFRTFSLPPPLNTLSLGICMDLNPGFGKSWNLDNGPFELASYCLDETADKSRTNVLVILSAWLDTNRDPNAEWDIHTLNYWIARLRPLWVQENDDAAKQDDSPQTGHQDTLVIISNRNGLENGILFAGTSALLRLRKGSGRPEVIGVMKRREEGIKIWTV